MSHKRVREEVVEELTRKLLGATGSDRKRIVCMEEEEQVYIIYSLSRTSPSQSACVLIGGSSGRLRFPGPAILTPLTLISYSVKGSRFVMVKDL